MAILDIFAQSKARELHALERLDGMLAQLAELGIAMNSEVTLPAALKRARLTASQLLRREYGGLFWLLSCAQPRDEGWLVYSKNLLFYQFSDYKRRGALVQMLQFLAELTDLPFENAAQGANRNEQPEWVSFTLGGEPVRWTLRTDTGSWELRDFFEKVDELLRLRGSARRLYYQYRVDHSYYVCMKPIDAEQLVLLTGLQFMPVTAEASRPAIR